MSADIERAVSLLVSATAYPSEMHSAAVKVSNEITRLRARVEKQEGALRHITNVVRAGNAYSPAMVHDFAARALTSQEEDENG